MASAIWNKKTVALIIGGSQNLGRSIVEHVVQNVGKGSTVIVTSRSKDRLESNLAQIKSGHPDVQVLMEEVDLSNPDPAKYKQKIESLIGADGCGDYEVALIIHNAATLGDVKKRVIDMDNVQELQLQFNINVSSAIALNSVFLKAVRNAKTKIVVNVTGDPATIPTPSFGMLCMVKSARHMLFSVLAQEEPNIKVLHFNPTLVDTDLLREIRDKSHDSGIRKMLQDAYERHQVLTADQCVCKFVKTLGDSRFESGQVVKASDDWPA